MWLKCCGGIVEERLVRTVGLDHDVFHREIAETGFFRQLVAGGHIGVVVLVVMKFERFSRHIGGERVVGVRQFRKFKSHLQYSF